MKLQHIRVEELRQFRQPFELANLAPGLNLLAGPNEAGKSTLARAIRAAFFERHRSTSVEDLLPWGEPGAGPSVEIDFTIDGTPYRLAKRFLHRKRCHLQIGTRELDGEEAEQHLAGLLGFQFPGRGASKPEHWGIPGLLWIEQGSAQDMREPLAHAGDHLRQALQQSVSEVSSSQGDDVIEQVRSEREKLLTGTGKPRGDYAQAIAERDDADRRVAELDQRIGHYREQVDQLGRLQQENASDSATRPWESLRQQQLKAEQQLTATRALAAQLDADRLARQQRADTLALLQAQRQSADEQQQQLSRRQADLQRADRAMQEAQASATHWSQMAEQAAQALQQAQAALLATRQVTQRTELLQRVHEAETRIAALDDAIARAAQAQEQLLAQRAQAAASALDKAGLARLRTQHARLAELQIRQQAVATRVRYELAPQTQLSLGGQALSGSGEQLLTTATELRIDAQSWLQIIPGGADLAALAREATELHAEHQALLQRLGLARLADAEAQLETWQRAQHDAELAQRALAHIAPQGRDALQLERDELASRAQTARQQLVQLGAPADPAADAPTPALPTLAQATAQHTQAQAHRDDVARQWDEARLQQGQARTRRDAAQQENDALQALLNDPQRLQRAQASQAQMLALQSEQQTLAQTIDQRQREVDAARVDILAQDVERLRRSAEQAQHQYNERQNAMTLLQGKLEQAGAQGLEEERASQRVQAQAADQRHRELALQAQALELLLGLLESRRSALTRRLQAPLHKHIDRYLQLLFPQATLDIGDDLAPGRLSRSASNSGPVTELSFGAREQMGVISRLAYADLLKEAGRPTLIILDDALVHSDAQRLEQMKRVLFDASQRHQVLLFTCHPELWRDLGAVPRAIAATAAG